MSDQSPATAPQVSVFIPAQNEAGNVSEVAKKVGNGCRHAGVRFEILFVDDGSTDGTGDELDALAHAAPNVRVFHHRKRLGITAAMVTAFREVRGDIVIWIPSDLECDPEEDIPKLLEKMREDDLDVVCGWRQGRHDGKVIASTIYNAVSRRLFRVSAHDMNWIKAFRRECLEGLKLRSDWHRFLVMIWAERGFRIGEVKTTWHRRRAGRSKFGFWRIPLAFFDVLALRFLMTFSRKPLLFFGGIGASFILSGLAMDCYLVWLYFATSTQKRPLFWLSLAAITVGFLLFCVGFLAELLVPGETVSPSKEQIPREDDE